MILRPEEFDVVPFDDATDRLEDPAGLRALARDAGALFFRGLLGSSTIGALRAWVREACVERGWAEPADDDPPRLTAKAGATMCGHGWDDPQWVELQRGFRTTPELAEVAGDAGLIGIVETLLEEPPRLATTNFCWLKLPGSPEHTTLPHQDLFYLPDCPRIWTVWVPLVDTPIEVGPHGVVKGSHRHGLWSHTDALHGIAVPADTIWTSSAVEPGDVVLFNALTVHCAWSNISPTQIRASLDLRYEPASIGVASLLAPG